MHQTEPAGANSKPHPILLLAPLFVLAVGLLAMFSDESSRERGTEELPAQGPTPPRWINAYGTMVAIGGEPAEAGTVITAHDSDGRTIGLSEVQVPGTYGLMAIYGDDPGTPEDEGAPEGGVMTFRVDNRAAFILGPDNPVWDSERRLLHINLAVP